MKIGNKKNFNYNIILIFKIIKKKKNIICLFFLSFNISKNI